MSPPAGGSILRRLLRQGLLLLGGFGGAQLLGFARNVLLGHLLSKADFGTAAALTITLQVFEMVSDIAADRMIVQAEDGDQPGLLAAAHTMLIGRGLLIGLGLAAAAAPVAALFGLPEAAPAFMAVAAVPVLKAFMHLDWRRAQRHLRNRPAVLVEVLPQAVALAMTWPAVALTGNYTAVLWVSLAQGLAMSVVSHLVATTPYRIGFDRGHLRRLMAFGWPILLSAIPLLAVFHGDRVIVARYLGIEELAGYTAAFLITMVPATLVVKVGMALMLPLLAEARHDRALLESRFILTCELTVLGASVYLALFAMLGGPVVELAFGSAYAGYAGVTAAVAMMWAVRLVQMPFGAVLMARGDNRPMLIAGLVRAAALVLALAAAACQARLAVVASCGALGEIASLVYLAWALRPLGRGFMLAPLARATFMALPVAVTAPFWSGLEGRLSLLEAGALAGVVAVFVVASAAALLPGTRGELRSRLAGRTARLAPAA